MARWLVIAPLCLAGCWVWKEIPELESGDASAEGGGGAFGGGGAPDAAAGGRTTGGGSGGAAGSGAAPSGGSSGADAGDVDSGGVPGLVAAYSFSENSGTSVLDGSGNGNHGIITGAQWGAGKYGSGLTFDGVSNFVVVAHSSSLAVSTAVTLEAWVKPLAIWTDFKAILIKNYDYYLYAASAPISCPTSIPLGGIYRNNSALDICGGSPPPTDAWTHFALTYDGIKGVLYQNGTEVGSKSDPGGIATATGTLQIGASQFGEHFAGSIDEVRVYSYARSQGEIQTDMATPLP